MKILLNTMENKKLNNHTDKVESICKQSYVKLAEIGFRNIR